MAKAMSTPVPAKDTCILLDAINRMLKFYRYVQYAWKAMKTKSEIRKTFVNINTFAMKCHGMKIAGGTKAISIFVPTKNTYALQQPYLMLNRIVRFSEFEKVVNA